MMYFDCFDNIDKYLLLFKTRRVDIYVIYRNHICHNFSKMIAVMAYLKHSKLTLMRYLTQGSL